VEEEYDSLGSEPPATFLSALACTDTVRKYLTVWYWRHNTGCILSNTENKVYSTQQKVRKTQLTLLRIFNVT
jgi:hypothetical protein